jgi:cyanophycinase
MELSVAAGAKLNSVRTILFKNAKASQEAEVIDILSKAEAIFMAGGDQSEYLEYWRGTQVQSIMQDKLSHQNVTIGGTSAGCMVLGNWVYSAEKGSITSEDALADPYHRYLTIAPAFLKIPFLESFITDTHFGK